MFVFGILDQCKKRRRPIGIFRREHLAGKLGQVVFFNGLVVRHFFAEQHHAAFGTRQLHTAVGQRLTQSVLRLKKSRGIFRICRIQHAERVIHSAAQIQRDLFC